MSLGPPAAYNAVSAVPALGNSVAPRTLYIAVHKNLIAAQLGDAHGEARSRAFTLHTPRVHSTKTLVEHRFQLPKRQVRDGDLADLGNQDEAFTRHVECAREFDIAGQNQHELIARTEPIVRIDRSAQIWLELGSLISKDIEPKDPFARGLLDCVDRLSGARETRARIDGAAQQGIAPGAHGPLILYSLAAGVSMLVESLTPSARMAL